MRRSLCISRIRNEAIKQMGVDRTIRKDVGKMQLKWYGHMQRMYEARLPKQVLEWQLVEKRKKGRPRLEWQRGVHKVMSERNLTPEDCGDRKG